MKEPKYFVVWRGRTTGIFETWDECKIQVLGFRGAQYKSFPTKMAAEKALVLNYADFVKQHQRRVNAIIPSYCVDASCIGNPGLLEYRCVETDAGRVIFAEGPFQEGTNNIGEFLAIVHALSYFKKLGITDPIYSDSMNALKWVSGQKCKTKQVRNERNAELFSMIANAENWLRSNVYKNRILKWNTNAWGETPADYKRK